MASGCLKRIAGVDEAGRGPLAGAVYAAAVILPEEYELPYLADSKKLTESRREALAPLIKQQALAWAVASASVEEIERLNILHASLLAMQRAIVRVHALLCADEAWIDGNRLPKNLPMPAHTLVRGDALMPVISAASILAKTTRDADMRALDMKRPEYGFAQHKGYPTAQHLAALNAYGVLPEHRKTFAPVKALLR